MADALIYINGEPELMDEEDVEIFFDEEDIPNFHRNSKEGPAICWPNGSEYYYEDGVLHREEGPAIVKVDGTKEWWFNGKRHREDGPAIVRANGYKAWYYNDVEYPFEIWKKIVTKS